MGEAAKERKVKDLYEKSMEAGGPAAFRMNFEQSLGVHTDEHMSQDGVSRQVQVFDKNRREVNYRDLNVGGCLCSLLGPDWRNKFEQNWVNASKTRFEGVGGVQMAGDLPYVSAALDVIAGLANARALDREQAPEWLWDRFCTPMEVMGEGGFDIGSRPNFDVSKQQDGTDLAPGQRGPTVDLVGTRIHRNRTRRQMKRVQINKWLVVNDMTGQIFQAVDDVADLVLYERERKVADMCMGIGSATDPAGQMSQDGLTFFPYQSGIYGATAGTNLVSPQNQKMVQDFANAPVGGDGVGFADYTFIVRALQILAANRDPFTGLPLTPAMEGMTLLVAPAAKPQIEYLLGQIALWQMGNGGLTNANGTNTVSGYDLLKQLRLEVIASQVWTNRVLDKGIQIATPAAGGAASYKANFTNAVSDTAKTAGSVLSFGILGHFKEAVKYHVLEPFTSSVVPLGPDQYAEQTVHIQDFHECGAPYFVNPRKVWRQYA